MIPLLTDSELVIKLEVEKVFISEIEKLLKSWIYKRLQFYLNHGVPFAQGSNKLFYIASLTKWGVKKLSLKKAIKLYKLDPKPEDLTVSRLKIFKNWRAEPVFVA